MRRTLLSIVALLALACGDSTAPAADLTITGTITLPGDLAASTVVVGEVPGSVGSLTTDGLGEIFGFGSTFTGSLTGAVTVGGGTASRTYSFTLPANPQGFGWLIAFVDLNGNGKIDQGERARVPMKTIEGSQVEVDWTTVTSGGGGTYYISVNNNKEFDLSTAGRSGFNFAF